MTKRLTWLAGAVLLAGLGTARPASAQGFSLFEQSACAMGRGGAGVAAPCDDGSAMFYNPAALADIEGRVLTVGGTLVAPRGFFENNAGGLKTDLESLNIPVPNFYYAQKIGSRAAIGLGVFVPYGLETKWPTTFNGRFIGYNARVQGAYIQPTFAFKASDQFMLGGGVDIAYYKLRLRQRGDLSAQPITGTSLTFRQIGVPLYTDFADVMIEGNDTSVGFHVGALLKPSEQFAIGARYISKQKISTTEGDITVEQIATGFRLPVPLGPTIPAGTPVDAILAGQFQSGQRLSAQKATTEITLPDQFVAGIAFKPSDRVEVAVDYQFTRWTEFDVLDIKGSSGLSSLVYEDYQDTNGLRAGVELTPNENVALRLGFTANSAAAPDQTVTPNLPEAARTTYSGGLGFKLGNHMRSNFYYMYLNQGKRDGRTSDCGVARPTVACNDGVYSFNAHLFGAGLTFVF